MAEASRRRPDRRGERKKAVRNNLASLLMGVVIFAAAQASASADQFTFDFNSVIGTSNSAVQTYMSGVLTGGKTVIVTGAKVDTTYNGDGHVVGPCSPTCKSTTLGPDAFIDTFSSTEIDMKFNFAITSVSFDYEIFPDGTCTSLTTGKCGSTTPGSYPNQPDFLFKTNLGQIFHIYGTTPASPNNHSPISGSTHAELTPQAIGTWSGPLNGGLNHVTELDFVDWPATIAIDNLVINPNPEPNAVILLATVLAGLGYLRRKKQLPSTRA